MCGGLEAVSIHAPHAGRNSVARVSVSGASVSIHAPHAGRDRRDTSRCGQCACFNPRAPCGARHKAVSRNPGQEKFQSTRPMRGATHRDVRPRVLPAVSIHAPHAGRDHPHCHTHRCRHVSIHAPHAGRDSKRGHDFPPLPRIYGYSPPQIRFSRHLRPTPLLRHDSRTYIFTFCFLFTSPSHSVMNTQMMIAASKS